MSDPSPTFTVLDHPLIQHKLAHLRARRSPKKLFRELVDEITTLMAYEVTRDLPLRDVSVRTPLERTTGRKIRGKKLVVVPILRAGLGMVDAVIRLIPGARVGHVGLFRDEGTLKPVTYFFKIPSSPEERSFIVVDPMLATGGSASEAVRLLKEAGAGSVRFMCIVAAPEGVEALSRAHPDLPIFAAALDRELNRDGFIVPGLGDAGDRLFGTR